MNHPALLFFPVMLFLMMLAVISTHNAIARRRGEGMTGRVIHVLDGDTLTVDFGEGAVRVRLNGIDAPEHGQAGAREATEWLRATVAGKEITVVGKETDVYGRLVGDLFLDESYVNYWLVFHGYAWALPRTPSGHNIAAAQRAAQGARRGIWREKYPVAPWEYRKATAGDMAPHALAV